MRPAWEDAAADLPGRVPVVGGGIRAGQHGQPRWAWCSGWWRGGGRP